MKRIIAIILSVLLLLPTVSIGVFAEDREELLLSETFESYAVSGEADLKTATNGVWQPMSGTYASAYLKCDGSNSYAVFKNFKAEALIDFYVNGKLYLMSEQSAAESLQREIMLRFFWYGANALTLRQGEVYYVDYDYCYRRGGAVQSLTDRTGFSDPQELVLSWEGGGTSNPAVEALTETSNQQIYGGDADLTPINSGWQASRITRVPLSIAQKSGYSSASPQAVGETGLRRLGFEFRGMTAFGDNTISLYGLMMSCAAVTRYFNGVKTGMSSNMLNALHSAAISALQTKLTEANYEICLDNVSVKHVQGSSVSLTIGEHGTVGVGDQTYTSADAPVLPVDWDGSMELSLTPDEGYVISSVTVDEAEQSFDKHGDTLSLEGIRGARSVAVSFAEKTAPYIREARIEGASVKQHTLRLIYEAADDNGDELDAPVIVWQRSENGTDWAPIAGANGETFEIPDGCVGAYLRASVTPYSKEEPKQGAEFFTEPTGKVVGETEPPSVTDVFADGTVQAGETLNARYTYQKSESGDTEGKTRFCWELSSSPNGPFETVETAASYTVTPEAAGRYLRLTVTPVDRNGLAGRAVSATPVKIPGSLTLFVATDGDDSNPGTIDAPLATVEAARDLLRTKTIPCGGATVYLRGGVYDRVSAFVLSAEDSGTKDAPIVYRNYGNEEVTFNGGYSLDYSAFSPVDGEMRDLLPEEARDRVVVADLSALGVPTVTEYAISSGDSVIEAPILLMGDHELHPARYPNDRKRENWPTMYCDPAVYPGTNQGNGQTDSRQAFTVHYDDRTAAVVNGWTYGLDHIIAEGYWMYNWYSSSRYVTFDREHQQISARENTATHYGVKAGEWREFCFKNVYQALDEAGEYYLDTDRQKLYLYPYEDASEVVMNGKMKDDMIRADGTKNVTIRGIRMIGGNKTAVTLNDTSSFCVSDCLISGFEQLGATVSGSENLLSDNEIRYCGIGGITLNGGDPDTITHANNVIDNNVIHDFSLLKPVYGAGVSLNGVGNTVRHNELYGCEHYAIYYSGVDNVIEYNDFHDANTNSMDMGAIYTGRHFEDHGTIMRYNSFRRIGYSGDGPYRSACIFVDDASCDSEIYGNFFYPGTPNVQTVMVHGGQTNNVYHNLFVDTPTLFRLTDWRDKNWKEAIMGTSSKYGASSYHDRLMLVCGNPLYQERWPWLKEANDAIKANNESLITFRGNIFAENLAIFVESAPFTLTRSPSNGKKLDGYYSTDGYTTIPGININQKGQRTDGGGISDQRLSGDTNRLYTENGTAYFEDFVGGDLSLNETGRGLLEQFGDEKSAYGAFEPIPFDDMGTYFTENAAPQADNVGILQNGAELNGQYEYSDAERDAEGESRFRWLRSDNVGGPFTEIDGANGTTYLPTDDDAGKFLCFEVTPVALSGEVGAASVSPAFIASVNKSALEEMILRVSEARKNTKTGDGLGEVPASAAEALDTALSQAKEVAENKSAGADEVSRAAMELSAAYSDFSDAIIRRAETNKDRITVADGLEEAEIVFTGDQKQVRVEFEGRETPQTRIRFGKAVFTLGGGTVLKDGVLTLTESDRPDAELTASVRHCVRVDGSFDRPVRIALDGTVNDSVIRAEQGSYQEIDAILAQDQAEALGDLPYGKYGDDDSVAVWTTMGGEYAVVTFREPSADATLKSVSVNGIPYGRFRSDLFSYQYALPAGTTALPTVEAVAQSPAAKVEIDQVTLLPGAASIRVTAEDGTELIYRIDFTVLEELPAPKPAPSDTSSGGKTITVGETGSGRPVPTPEPLPEFTDIGGHWAEQQIRELHHQGVVFGVTKTEFAPDLPIIRAEVAALVARTLHLSSLSAQSVFADVSADEWYAREVSAAESAGLISGYAGNFRPEETMTREEFAVVVVKAYQLLGKTAVEPEDGVVFEDRREISDWALSFVEKAAANGLMIGTEPKRFEPLSETTRAEVAAVIRKLQQQ